MRPRSGAEGAFDRLNLDAIRAYKKKDREALLKLLARPRKLGIPEQTVNFLIMLGVKGDEAEILKRLGRFVLRGTVQPAARSSIHEGEH